MPTRLLPLSKTEYVEEEINNKFINNKDLKKEDLQVFVELSENNLAPIQFGFNPDNTIKIYDEEEAIGKNIYIGSKRQFLYCRFNIQYSSIKLNINVEEFKTGWDPSKYLVFRNGYLMNSNMYRIYTASFDNFISRKVLYSLVQFNIGDRIDIFYIESEDNMNPIPINRDVYLTVRKQYATMNFQTLFPVPYPYPEYPRGKNMFFVCDMEGHYLDNRYDYQVAVDAEHITLRDDHSVKSAYTDYLIYTFPYVKQDWEDEGSGDEDILSGNKSGVDFIYSYSIPSPNNRGGIVNFYPKFDQYNIDKRCCMLFCNSTFISPDRYNIVDNDTIELLDPIDKEHSVYSQFTMVIFKEQGIYDIDNIKFEIEVHQIEATEDQQQKFYIPNVQIQKPSFLVFIGSINFDQKDRFRWKQEINRMDIIEEEEFVEKGRILTFIFYKPLLPKLIRDKEIYFKKMVFDVADDSGYVTIPSKIYNDIDFNPSNLILFLNGTFLQPDRYSINNNTISMNSTIDDAFDDTKTLVGIYLVAYKPNYMTEREGPYDYTDMKEDHDWIVFDELYAVPKLVDSIINDIDCNLNINKNDNFMIDINCNIQYDSYKCTADEDDQDRYTINGTVEIGRGIIYHKSNIIKNGQFISLNINNKDLNLIDSEFKDI